MLLDLPAAWPGFRFKTLWQAAWLEIIWRIHHFKLFLTYGNIFLHDAEPLKRPKHCPLKDVPELWVDGEGLADDVVEHHLRDVRLGDDKVAVDDAQLGAVLERLAVKAQLIQQAPAPDERRKKTPVKHAGGACNHFTKSIRSELPVL